MVTPPWFMDPIEHTAFNCFAMECEGMLPTRKGKLNQLIDMLAAGPYDDYDYQCQCYDAVGIDSDTFTNEEERYIVENVLRKTGR